MQEVRDAGGSAVMEIRIWGARGSVPTPGARHAGVGGNTPCVEARLASGARVIFDAGTGIRLLGREIAEAPARQELHIFLTHFHWDHLQGLPYFSPLYSSQQVLVFHSASPAGDLQRVLRGQMTRPYFPVEFDSVPATMRFEQLGDPPFTLQGLTVSGFPLHHPGGACGFVLECGGTRVVYATDHEHGDDAADAHLLHAAEGADVLLLDTQFTPEEYETHRGWGHGTWLQATRVAAAARVRRLLLFHHHPAYDDAKMQSILEQAQRVFAATELAHEGLVLRL